MDYQLVLQFNEDVFSYDEMISFENKLEMNLTGVADIDGHDFGSGEINFFIFSNNPINIFNKILLEIINPDLQGHLRAAYRHIDEEDFKIIWPDGSTEFDIA